jgi:hypothetical protein
MSTVKGLPEGKFWRFMNGIGSVEEAALLIVIVASEPSLASTP